MNEHSGVQPAVLFYYDFGATKRRPIDFKTETLEFLRIFKNVNSKSFYFEPNAIQSCRFELKALTALHTFILYIIIMYISRLVAKHCFVNCCKTSIIVKI